MQFLLSMDVFGFLFEKISFATRKKQPVSNMPKNEISQSRLKPFKPASIRVLDIVQIKKVKNSKWLKLPQFVSMAFLAIIICLDGNFQFYFLDQ